MFLFINLMKKFIKFVLFFKHWSTETSFKELVQFEIVDLFFYLTFCEAEARLGDLNIQINSSSNYVYFGFVNAAYINYLKLYQEKKMFSVPCGVSVFPFL